jgi:HEAT repeat protein
VLFFCIGTAGYSQINRTTDTKVADILAQIPAKNEQSSNTLMKAVLSLKKEGILKFCDMLVPLGSGDDSSVRYTLNSLAMYVGGNKNISNRNSVEEALLTAIRKTKSHEIKTFLIERLQYCASNASIKDLNGYLYGNEFYKPALAVLLNIKSKEAAQAVLVALKESKGQQKVAYIAALGKIKYNPAVATIKNLSNSNSIEIQRHALKALASIANENSYETLYKAAKKVDFQAENTEAVLSFIHFGMQQNNAKINKEIAKVLLKKCTSNSQLHFRIAGLQLLSKYDEKGLTKRLLKEFKHKNNAHRGAVLKIASKNLTSNNLLKWTKSFKKASPEGKVQLLGMLQSRPEKTIVSSFILPAINSKHEVVKIAGIKALAFQPKERAFPILFDVLSKQTTPSEVSAIKGSLLRLTSKSDINTIANNIAKTSTDGKVVLLDVLAARKATSKFQLILSLLSNNNEQVKETVYKALPVISTPSNLSQLMNLLNTTDVPDYVSNIQEAIRVVLDESEEDLSGVVLDAFNTISKKEKLLPVFSVLKNKEALNLVISSLKSKKVNERTNALEALSKWRNNDAIPYLFDAASTNTALHSEAFRIYLSQVNRSSHPEDQKLLLIKKIMPFSKNTEEQKRVIKGVRSIKTFLSLIYVSKYLGDEALRIEASKAAIRIALPTPGKNNGLSGTVVREIVTKSIHNITGPDSQYIKIDVTEFLDKMPNLKGFESIFNGDDLSGWQGLVKNPIARAKMTKKQLAGAQEKANAQMLKDWFVKEGVIGFKGEGYNNICTIKKYGDFEMLVDWKITNGGDSGIYLRGTPQVQIWDIALTDVGAQVGSGGLYNNQKNKSKPLVVADNTINDWNTFRIKMVGERVTVHLNGFLVTDNVILENYWDKKLPIFTKEAIELQAHGEDLGFRNVYVREISSGNASLPEEEIKEGFTSLFNGSDLDHWVGNKTDYLVENNELVVRPEQGGYGNLYSAKEYSDFNFRFEFKLTPGANNGLGIHAPLEGDAAYVGKELQILDNTASIYANLKPYQYHGSVYGVIAAKRGFLKPVGEWNSQEVIVKGNDIKIILNGTVIVDGNWEASAKNGTLDKKNHPGLKRNKGHIGFLGHGSELQFRNIRIKDLSKKK